MKMKSLFAGAVAALAVAVAAPALAKEHGGGQHLGEGKHATMTKTAPADSNKGGTVRGEERADTRAGTHGASGRDNADTRGKGKNK